MLVAIEMRSKVSALFETEASLLEQLVTEIETHTDNTDREIVAKTAEIDELDIQRCLVCFEAAVSCILDCNNENNTMRHACVCEDCFESLLSQTASGKPRCPYCRGEVTKNGSVPLSKAGENELVLDKDYQIQCAAD